MSGLPVQFINHYIIVKNKYSVAFIYLWLLQVHFFFEQEICHMFENFIVLIRSTEMKNLPITNTTLCLNFEHSFFLMFSPFRLYCLSFSFSRYLLTSHLAHNFALFFLYWFKLEVPLTPFFHLYFAWLRWLYFWKAFFRHDKTTST